MLHPKTSKKLCRQHLALPLLISLLPGAARANCPGIEEAAEDMPEIQFYKVDVDEAPELARSFKVMSVPTLAFFKNGELVKKNVGAVSYEELEELINSVK